MNQLHQRAVIACLVLTGACVFLVGIDWGLPSRRVDPLLFGDRPVWSGVQIERQAGGRTDQSLAADVDPNPVARGGVVNDTDQRRAEIIRRYRLYTCQPDEMITLMALASMKVQQGDFDPRLYQYGGLWIYPIGAMLKLMGIVPSQAYYLDHPEEFGCFYVVMRMYAATWGLVGVWAVFRLAKNASAGLLGAAAAALLYILLPVVVNLAHEAKPHLPGAALILLAALAGERFVHTGLRRWWIISGVICGAAAAMVLSAWVAWLILPAMTLMRPMAWSRRIGVVFAASVIALAVYFAANPYVLIHLVGDAAPLISNLRNTARMYPVVPSWRGLLASADLIAEGTAPVTAMVGVIAAICLMRPGCNPSATGLRLLNIVGGVVMVQFAIFATGKSDEYGRFALVADVALAASAATLIGRTKIRGVGRVLALAVLIALTAFPGLIYLRSFVRDSVPLSGRMEDAHTLAKFRQKGAATLGVFDEPAPYLLPPVDVFGWRIVLLPREFQLASGETPVDVIVRPVDRPGRQPAELGGYRLIRRSTWQDLFSARMSWADKPIEIWVSKSLADQ